MFLSVCKAQSCNKIISKLYNGFLQTVPENTFYVRDKWKMEGNFNISDEDWEKICKTQWKSTSSAIWRELCWKNVIRFFITPSQKKHQGKGISAGDYVRKRKLTTTIFLGGGVSETNPILARD